MRWFWAVWILLAGALAAPVTFSYNPPQGLQVQSVSLRGQMNNWGQTPMALEGKVWSVSVDLTPGKYQYKFFINGQWPQDMCDGKQYAAVGGKIDAEAEACVDDGNGGRNAVRTISASTSQTPTQPQTQAKGNPAPPLAVGYSRVNYFRPDGNYSGWGLHLWEDTTEKIEWNKPFAQSGTSDYGVYWDFKLKDGAKKVGFIVHKGDEKDPGPDMFIEFDKHPKEVWVLSGSAIIYTQRPDTAVLPKGDLGKAQAHWLDRTTLVWKPQGYTDNAQVRLMYSLSAGLKLNRDGLSGGFSLPLKAIPLSPALKAKWPHLASYQAFEIPADEAEKAAGLVKNQVALVATDVAGKLLDATGIQLPGVLDDLYAYEGELGVSWQGSRPILRVWAPTARSVNLLLFDGNTPQSLEMKEEKGVWSVQGEASWKNKYYLYEVKVYLPQSGKYETFSVTDPYSLSLSLNSKRSQIVDLNDAALKPQGWDVLKKPVLEAFEDSVIYELHIRDFSVFDSSVPQGLRGTYLAFTQKNSNGVKHLKKLADAGLTHLHLLPAFDIASVNEDKSTWKSPSNLEQMAPDSDGQQKAIAANRDADGYNWGYDPYHFNVPEGAYATQPEGSVRIVEFRQMVAALNNLGLRMVMDVVYNHTSASGTAQASVLDKIVPGYYHRLNKDGNVETSTCCQNTATEHRMMEKLMVDSVVLWAKHYKVDGFRFDLMGHHMKANMEAVRKALNSLTLVKDGVDGQKILLYGEGWNFGEVANNARGLNATQSNMAGTGIATFNDRLRDAVRGGGPFGDPREQGFATGLFGASSGFSTLSSELQRQRLLAQTQWIRVGLAGGLKDYMLTPDLMASRVDYNGSPAGYTADPQEVINYVSKHDNETLFDAVMYKASAQISLVERIRMHNLAQAVVLLSQGIPFVQAGDDLLRSKSGDRNSYNSGDWFNRLDWSYTTHNWGIGLPMQSENADRYGYLKPLLAQLAWRPNSAQIQGAAAYFQELLKLRKSSALFRLRTAQEVNQRLSFPAQEVPGVVVMQLDGRGLDPSYTQLLVFFNANPTVYKHSGNGNWQLHPLQRASVDAQTQQSGYAAGVFSVPARTTAVFVLPK